MTSEMVERAAKAVADKWLEKVDDTTARIGPPVLARAALLAALDPKDDKLIEAMARAIFGTTPRARYFAYEEEIRDVHVHTEMREVARAALCALKAAAQGETS